MSASAISKRVLKILAKSVRVNDISFLYLDPAEGEFLGPDLVCCTIGEGNRTTKTMERGQNRKLGMLMDCFVLANGI